MSTRSGDAGARRPDVRERRGAPGGRREAGTAPWCRTKLCGRPVALDGRVRDNGGVTEPSARSRSASAADDVLAAAVELARAAAVETAGDPALVGRPPGRGAGAGGAGDRRGRARGDRCGAHAHVRQHAARLRRLALGGDPRPVPRRGRGDRRRGRAAARRAGAARARLGAVARAAAPRRPLGRRRAALHRGRPPAGAGLHGRRRLRRRPRGQRRGLRARARPGTGDVARGSRRGGRAAGRPASSARRRRWPGTRPARA